MSLVALFVALGGTSYAAFRMPRNSVGTGQLKNGAVTGSKIRNGAVSAVKINAAGLTVPSAAQASDSTRFAGHGPSYFLPATGTAADSALLGGFPASHFLPASGTAADSSLLGGFPASHFLPTTGTAADSSLLGGFPASHFLPATGAAVDSNDLGGFPAATYYRLRTGPVENTATTVDSGDVGQYGSVTVGSDGMPVISYYDVGSKGLKVVHCGSLDCGFGDTATMVDDNHGSGGAGSYTSITIGADGLPLVSYSSNSGLRVAHCGNVSCTSGTSIATVDSSPGVGAYTSVTIGADGLPFISYYDDTNGDLKVAHCGNLDCSSGNTLTAVDSSGNVGTNTSVALGLDGLPLISYGDRVSGFLKVLHCGNAACTSGNTVTAVDTSSCCSSGNSTTIGSDGLPLISYFQGSQYHMIVLHCGDVSCSSGNTATTVGIGNNDAGAGTVTVGPDGLPLIAYYTLSKDLDVMHCGDYACSGDNVVTTLANEPNNVGGYASLTIGADGLPMLIDYDAYNGALKTLHCADVFCVPYFRRR